MTNNVLYGIDFSAKRERDHVQFLLALSQYMAPDVVFVDEEPSKRALMLAAKRLCQPDKDSA